MWKEREGEEGRGEGEREKFEKEAREASWCMRLR